MRRDTGAKLIEAVSPTRNAQPAAAQETYTHTQDVFQSFYYYFIMVYHALSGSSLAN